MTFVDDNVLPIELLESQSILQDVVICRDANIPLGCSEFFREIFTNLGRTLITPNINKLLNLFRVNAEALEKAVTL